MKRFYWNILLVTSFVCPLSLWGQEREEIAHEADSLQLSLADALHIGLSENTSVRIADISVEKQAYAHRDKIASLFPKIDGSISYSYTFKKPVIFLQMPGMPEPRGIEMGQTHNLQLSATAAMPLIAPQLWESIAMSNSQMSLSLEKARSAKIDMVEEIRKAYMAALLAERSCEVLLASYNNARGNYKQIEDQFAQGLIADFDRLRAEVQVMNIEPNLLKAEQSSRLAKKRLCVLLAIDPDTPIVLTEHLSDYANRLYQAYFNRDTNFDNNSSLRQLAIQDSLLVKSKRIKQWEYLPTLSVATNYSYGYMNNEFKLSESKLWTPNAALNFQLSIPIFSSGKRYFGVKQADADLTMLRLRRTDTQRQISLAIDQQNDRMETAIKSYGAAHKAVGAAEKGYSIARKRYESGAGTLLEVNDADLQLLQARLNEDQAVYEFMTAMFALEKLTGKGIPKEYNEIKD